MYYFIYYTMTTKCNLKCGYCFRESLKENSEVELDLEGIKKLIDCLYHKYNIRKISISGGEPSFLGEKPGTEFLKLIEYLRQYKSDDPQKNLKIVLLTNGVFLTPEVSEKCVGVIDRITMTVDSLDDSMLTKLGRNTEVYKRYLDRIKQRFTDFTSKGFEIKLHSVVSKVNYKDMPALVDYIASLKDVNIVAWKFFEYMPFGNPKADEIYLLKPGHFPEIVKDLNARLEHSKIKPNYKDLEIEESTILNLLADGSIKYSELINGKWVFKYSEPIFNYDGWDDLLAKCNISRRVVDMHKLKI